MKLDGVDHKPLPLSHRKARLARMLTGEQTGIALNDHTDARGDLVFQQACAMGLEGIVSKRLGSSPTLRRRAAVCGRSPAYAEVGRPHPWLCLRAEF
jgi:ATP-dependent DNA ligase